MTQREFFKAVAENENVNSELREYAENAITKLDEKNAKRSSTPTKTQKKNAVLKGQILEFMRTQSERITSAALAEKFTADGEAISTNLAAALLRQLATEGELTVEDIKNPKGKGKVKGYLTVTE